MTVALTSDPAKTYIFSAKVNLHEISTLTPPQLNGSLGNITVTNIGDTVAFTPASFSDPDWSLSFDIEDESIAEWRSGSNPGEYATYGKADGTTYVRYCAQFVNYQCEIGRQKVIVGNGVGSPCQVNDGIMDHLVIGSAAFTAAISSSVMWVTISASAHQMKSL